MSQFFSTYKGIMNQRGADRMSRNFNFKQRSFNKYFDESLNKYNVVLNGENTDLIIQDMNQNNNKDLSDDKYIISKLDTPLNVGSLVYWDDRFWLIFTNEHKTIKTHNQAKIKASNYVIKWATGNMQVCNNGEGYQAFVQNQTLYTLGVSKSGSYSWIVNAKMMMYMPYNKETEAVKIGQRIFIGDNVYQVMFKDNVSRNGLINYLLEEDFINPNYDDLNLKVANYYQNPNDNPNVESNPEDSTITSEEKNEVEETEGESTNKSSTLELLGASTLKIKKTIVIDSVVKDADGNVVTDDAIVSWALSDLEGAVSVISQDVKSITLQATTNYDLIGSIFTIIATTKSGITNSKTIELVGAY